MTAPDVQLIPGAVDSSSIFTASGFGALGGMFYAAARRYQPDRLGRVVVLGTLGGAAAGTVSFLVLILNLGW